MERGSSLHLCVHAHAASSSPTEACRTDWDCSCDRHTRKRTHVSMCARAVCVRVRVGHAGVFFRARRRHLPPSSTSHLPPHAHVQLALTSATMLMVRRCCPCGVQGCSGPFPPSSILFLSRRFDLQTLGTASGTLWTAARLCSSWRATLGAFVEAHTCLEPGNGLYRAAKAVGKCRCAADRC